MISVQQFNTMPEGQACIHIRICYITGTSAVLDFYD